MKNQLIGIVGVFVLTFCLIALYHLIGRIGRHRKRHAAQIGRVRIPGPDRRPRHHARSGKDDAWLLRSPDTSERAGPSTPRFPNLSEKKHSWLRRESR